MNSTAHTVVAFESSVAAPRAPKAVWLPPPPNAPARSARFPVCSSTTKIKTSETHRWMMVRKIWIIGVSGAPADYNMPPRERQTGGIGAAVGSTARGLDDRRELGGVEGSAAHEPAVDLAEPEQPGGVLGRDRPPIEDADPSGGRRSAGRAELLADHAVNLSDLLR